MEKQYQKWWKARKMVKKYDKLDGKVVQNYGKPEEIIKKLTKNGQKEEKQSKGRQKGPKFDKKC